MAAEYKMVAKTFFNFYERNIKYWFRDSQKNLFIDFLDELGLFIGENPIFTKKKFPSLCRLPWFHGCPNEIFWKMQVRDFSFFNEGIGLTGVSFQFWPKNKFRRVAPIRIFYSFFTFKCWRSSSNIDEFYCWGLIWCKILCWA
jgi:hypothetical protein